MKTYEQFVNEDYKNDVGGTKIDDKDIEIKITELTNFIRKIILKSKIYQ